MIRRSCFILVILPLFSTVATGGVPWFHSTEAFGQDPGSELQPAEALRQARDAINAYEDGADAEAQPLIDELTRLIAVIDSKAPRHPWLTYLRGTLFAIEGDLLDAINALKKFVKTDEGRAEWRAFRLLGNLQVDSWPNLARSSFQAAGALNTNDPGILYGLAICAQKRGQIDEAITFATRAAESRDDPNKLRRISYADYLARLFLSQRSWADATKQALDASLLAEDYAIEKKGSRKPLEVLLRTYQLLWDIDVTRLNAPPGEDVGVISELLRGMARWSEKFVEIQGEMVAHDLLRVVEQSLEGLEPAMELAFEGDKNWPAILKWVELTAERVRRLGELGREAEAREICEQDLSDERQATLLEGLELANASLQDRLREAFEGAVESCDKTQDWNRLKVPLRLSISDSYQYHAWSDKLGRPVYHPR